MTPACRRQVEKRKICLYSCIYITKYKKAFLPYLQCGRKWRNWSVAGAVFVLRCLCLVFSAPCPSRHSAMLTPAQWLAIWIWNSTAAILSGRHGPAAVPLSHAGGLHGFFIKRLGCLSVPPLVLEGLLNADPLFESSDFQGQCKVKKQIPEQ
jgi:hypothetical protein